MELNTTRNPLLYSIGTYLAYKIAKRYYGNVHYVWCTTEFSSTRQPPTSNPATICKRYLHQIATGDRHTKEIDNNMAGILKGAKAKLDSGVITDKAYNEIRSIVSAAEYESFFPMLYVIESRKVKNRCKEVSIVDKASDDAVEYKIEDLKENEFKAIFFKDILDGIINVADKKAGKYIRLNSKERKEKLTSPQKNYVVIPGGALPIGVSINKASKMIETMNLSEL